MNSQDIYLDSNATTPVLPIAAKAAFETMEYSYGNPSSAHITGIRAKYIMENTRQAARKLLGADSGNLIFTSGATEGIQTAIISSLWGAREAGLDTQNYKLLYGATEHKAIPETLKHWNKLLHINAEVLAIPVDEKGLLDLDFIAHHAAQSLIICTMAVNNETGVFQNLSALEQSIRQHNNEVKWLVDCVQALGKLDLDLSQISIDYAPFSGHKLYAPKGIGMLYIREGAPYTPIIAGGGQESGLRSGTENLPGIAALGSILQALNDENSDIFSSHQHLIEYRQQLATALEQAFPEVVFNNDFTVSVPTTLNFAVKGLAAKEIMDLFDAANIRVSSGSACSSKVIGSFVLDAMGLPRWQSESAIRMSFGPAITQQEVDKACAAIKQAASALQTSCIINTDSSETEKGQLDGLVQLHYDGACTWILADKDSHQCVIIDPVAELAERVENMVRCRNYQVRAIIDTHSHADHESCAPVLRTVMHNLMSKGEIDALGWPTDHLQVTDVNGQAMQAIRIGRYQLNRIHTPGHTLDSISILVSDVKDNIAPDNIQFAFVGDMILIGGLGRTDFGISSAQDFYHSLQKLSQCVKPQTVLCSAHDYNMQFTTTLGTEVQCNPLLKQVMENKISEADFIQRKFTVDEDINEQQTGTTIMCGALSCAQISEDGMDVSPDSASSYLFEHKEAIVLDVREAHEHSLHALKNLSNVENVPLTRLTGFMSKLLKEKDKDQEVICICRSGSRSEVVAKTLRRLGFKNARQIQGGFALYN